MNLEFEKIGRDARAVSLDLNEREHIRSVISSFTLTNPVSAAALAKIEMADDTIKETKSGKKVFW